MDKVLQMNFDIRGNELHLKLSGRLDTQRAIVLEQKMQELPPEVDSIFFDMDGLEYIASAGLRILFWAVDYTDEKGGEAKVKNVSPEVKEVFKLTGFNELLTFE